ncbi:endonuclease III [Caulifigura coniformis]|nr:endonuclease III [Caulifigura coniformis]
MSTSPSPKPRICKAPRESQAARATRTLNVAGVLADTYANATCALRHNSAFQLLAATILSAQCTDERVNMVTPELFREYPTPQALAEARQEDVERIVQSTGFFRAKANSLRGMAQGLVERFDGKVPRSLEDLVTLPGVGRKTANVVLGTVYGIASGVVVDTHVTRITNLLALTTHRDAVKIELDLMKLLPETEWVDFSHRLIHHGRKICIARRPKCTECPLLPLCPRVGLPELGVTGSDGPAAAKKTSKK